MPESLYIWQREARTRTPLQHGELPAPSFSPVLVLKSQERFVPLENLWGLSGTPPEADSFVAGSQSPSPEPPPAEQSDARIRGDWKLVRARWDPHAGDRGQQLQPGVRPGSLGASDCSQEWPWREAEGEHCLLGRLRTPQKQCTGCTQHLARS